MATARDLGKAYVSIVPDTAKFKPELESALKKAMAGANASVKVDGDTKPLTESVKKATKEVNSDLVRMKNEAKALLSDGLKLYVDSDDTKATAKLDKLRAELTAISNMKVEVDPEVSDTAVAKAQAKLSAVKASLDAFAREEVTATADVNTARAMAKMGELDGILAIFGSKRAVAKADVDTSPAKRALASLFGSGGYFDKTVEKDAENSGRKSGGFFSSGFGTGLPPGALIPIVGLALAALPAAVGTVGAAAGVGLGAGIIALAISELKKNAKQLNSALKRVTADQKALATAQGGAPSSTSIIAKQASDAVLANSIKQLSAQKSLTAAQKTTLQNDKIKLAYGQQQLANLQSQGATSGKTNAAAVQAAKEKLKSDQETVQALQQQQNKLAAFQKVYNDLKDQGKVVTQALFGAVKDSGFLKAADVAVNKLGGEVIALRPQLQRLFASSTPYIQSFVNALTGLVSSTLPGLNTMLRQAQGPLTAFISGLGTLVGTQLSSWFEESIPFIQKSAGFFDNLVKTLGTLGRVLIDFGGAAASILEPALGAVNSVLQAVLPQFRTLALTISSTLGPSVRNLGAAFVTQAVPALNGFLKILTALVGPISAVINFVAKLANSMPWLTTSILAVWGAIKLWGGISGIISTVTTKVLDFASTLAKIGEKALPLVSSAAAKLATILAGLPLGPIGIAAAALATIIGVGLFAAMSNTKTAAQKLDEQLQHNIDTAETLGQKYSAAQRLVSVTADQYAQAQKNLAEAQRAVASGSGAANQAIRAGIPVSQQAATAVSSQRDAYNKAKAEAKFYGDQLRENTNLSPALVNAILTENTKLSSQLTTAEKLTQAWDQLNGVSQNYSQNAQSLQGAIEGLTKDQRTQGVTANQLWGDQNQVVSSLGQMADANQNAMAAAQGNTAQQKLLRKAMADQIAAALDSVPINSAAAAQILAIGSRALGTNSNVKDLRKAIRDAGGQAQNFTTDTQKAAGQVANLGAKADNSRTRLEKLAYQMGVSRDKADKLAGSIRNLPRKTQIQILEAVKGSGTINVSAAMPGLGVSTSSARAQQQRSNLLITGHADGGLIQGPGTGTSDSIPARLSNGEYVVKASAVQKVGVGHLDAVNSGKVAGFAGGGLVNSSKSGYTGVTSGNHTLIPDTVRYTEPIIKKATSAALKALQQAFSSSVAYNASAGVRQWLPDVIKALALNHLPASLANQVLRQISTESGGNPNAINLWDSNARAGHPSQGLLQTIPSTFAAYHIPGTSMNIRDPLANIAAAINYAKHVYGPGLMSGGMGLGSGHGYKFGGMLPEKVLGLGATSGKPYAFGAGEQVKPSRKMEKSVDQSARTNDLLSMLISQNNEHRKILADMANSGRTTAASVSGRSPLVRRGM